MVQQEACGETQKIRSRNMCEIKKTRFSPMSFSSSSLSITLAYINFFPHSLSVQLHLFMLLRPSTDPFPSIPAISFTLSPLQWIQNSKFPSTFCQLKVIFYRQISYFDADIGVYVSFLFTLNIFGLNLLPLMRQCLRELIVGISEYFNAIAD